MPSGWTVGFKLPAGLTLADVYSARLTALHATAFELEVIYDIEVKVPLYPDLDTALAKARRTETDKANKKIPLTAYTDLGVDVLGAFVFSDGRSPLLVNGKPLKSINAWANKQNTKIRTVHDTERKNIFTKQKSKAYHDEVDMPVYPSTIPSKKLDRVWQTRNDHVDNYLHTASSRVIKLLVDTGVKVLVIGWSPGFKDSVNMGRVNNQKFAMIPHARWRDQLIYKGSAAGILVITKEESYTSKASFLDQDFIPTWGKGDRQGWKPSGKRVKRGMYESADGILIHADVNGAYNGLAKHVVRLNPNRVVTDKGVVVHPVWLEMPGLNHRPAKPDLQTPEASRAHTLT